MKIAQKVLRTLAGIRNVGLASLAFQGPVISPVVQADEKPICVQADEWIAAHKGALPRSYADFVSLPKGYHRRVYSHLAPIVKAELWRSHITITLRRQHLNLSDDQIVFLRSILPKITTSAFASGIPPATSEEIQAVFPDSDLAHTIFATIGPGAPSTTVSEAPPDAVESLESGPVPNSVGDCTCYAADPGYLSCPHFLPLCARPPEGYWCHSTSSGCGSWWLDPCDAICCRNDLSACA